MKISRKLPLIIGVQAVFAVMTVPSVYAQKSEVVENNPPKIKTSRLAPAKENESYRFQIEAVDKDDNGRALNFRLKKGVKGLRLSSQGEVSYQPGFKAAGSYELVVGVSDGQLSDEKTLRLQVENSNRLPVIITDSLPAAIENKPYLVAIDASDADAEKLTFKLKKAPKGMKLSGNKIQWEPSFEQAGSYTIELHVSDPFETATKSLNVEVANTNRVPYYIGKRLFNVDENQSISIPLKAKDDDEDALQFSLKSAPDGLTLDGAGAINWLPTYEQAGSYDIDFIVSDGDLSSGYSIKIDVKAMNRLPEITSAALPQAKENQPYQYLLKAEDPDKEDARALKFSLKGSPDGVSISPSGLIEWTPSFNVSGEQKITAVITDGKGSTKKILPIIVENTNRPPSFSSNPVLLAKEAKAYVYKMKPFDPDKNELTTVLLSGPEGMTLEKNKLLFAPGYTHAGSYDVLLEVSDGELSAQQAFTLEVENTNRAPEIKAIEDDAVVLLENKAWAVYIESHDADNEKVDLTLLTYPQGLKLEDNKLVWTPGFEQADNHNVVIEASDGIDATSYSVKLLVHNVNRLAAFTGEMPAQAKENKAFSYQLTASDPDRQALVFNLLKGPEGMSIDGDTLAWTPTFEQAGQHEVTVSVFDSEQVVKKSFILDVENTNRAPVFPDPVVSVLEDQVYFYDINAVDSDGDKVTLTVVAKPEGMDFNGKRLKFKPSFKQAGQYPVEIIATDGDLKTTQKFELTVENVNRKPIVTSKPSDTAHETLEYTYQVIATDADDESLKMTLQQAPDGMKIKSGLVSWTPRYSQGGANPVVVVVTDGLDSITQTFAIKVDNANRTPNLEQVADQKVGAGAKFAYQLVFSDPDGDKVSFSLKHAPRGMVVSKKGKISWKTGDVELGLQSVIVEASDGDLKRRRMFDVEVVEPQQ